MKKKAIVMILAITIPISLLFSCAKNTPTEPSFIPDQGKLLFALDSADNIASGTVTITKGSITHVLPITISNHTGSVAFEGIQVGTWSITVQLFDADGVEIYSGAGEAVVTKNQTTTVTITVEENTGTLIIIVEIPQPSTALRFTFLLRESGQLRLYAMNIDGTNLMKIIDVPPNYNLEGSLHNARPNRKYVFIANANQEIWTMNLDGTNAIQVFTSDQKLYYTRWSWDGSKISAISRTTNNLTKSIITLNADGSKLKTIVQYRDRIPYNFYDPPRIWYSLSGLAWTKDNRIVFGYSKSQQWDPIAPRVGTSDIKIINSSGGSVSTIISRTWGTSQGGYSLKVYDCSERDEIVVHGEPDSWTNAYTLTGGRIAGFPAYSQDYHYSPDGEKIVFKRSSGISVVNRDGSDIQVVPNVPSGAYFPRFIY